VAVGGREVDDTDSLRINRGTGFNPCFDRKTRLKTRATKSSQAGACPYAKTSASVRQVTRYMIWLYS